VTGVAIATSDGPVEDGAADEETDVTAGEPSAGDADWPAPADAQLLSSATATQKPSIRTQGRRIDNTGVLRFLAFDKVKVR